MNDMHRATVGAISIVVSLGVAPTSAQVRALSVPVSGDRVVLQVDVVERGSATVTVLNGGTARVQAEGSDPLGLVPVVREGGIDLLVFEILPDPATGNEGLRQIARLRLDRDRAESIEQAQPPIEVRWVDTLPQGLQEPPSPNGPCSTCCVLCDDVLFCGCVVITECGSCCCPAVCQCPVEAPAVSESPGRCGTRDAGRRHPSDRNGPRGME
jgi:hypothetical protein